MLMSALSPNTEYSIEIEKSIENHIVLYIRNLLHSLVHFKCMEIWLQNQILGTIKWIDLSENQIPFVRSRRGRFPWLLGLYPRAVYNASKNFEI